VKALSGRQPWAGLITIGAKQYETRSRRSHYRSPIAIHAWKKLGSQERDFCHHPLVSAAYRSAGVIDPEAELRLGVVIATARLVAVHRTEDLRERLSPEERAFGFYNDGRFARELAEVTPLDRPVPAAGMLGLWEWERP
jgi:hypothetical protein